MKKPLRVFTFRSSALGTIPKGTIAFSILNDGLADGRIGGTPLKAGTGQVLPSRANISAPPVADETGLRTYEEFAYEGTGTSFLVTVIVAPELG